MVDKFKKLILVDETKKILSKIFTTLTPFSPKLKENIVLTEMSILQ